MRGRKPKPTALKILSGVRDYRLNPSEPTAAPGRPEPPTHLDAHAVDAWERLCDELEAVGVLNRSHGFALEIFASAYSRMRIAQEALGEHGALLITTGGTEDDPRVVIKSNPAAAMATAAESIQIRILTEFGLTASSATKVIGKRDDETDELGDFLERQA